MFVDTYVETQVPTLNPISQFIKKVFFVVALFSLFSSCYPLIPILVTLHPSTTTLEKGVRMRCILSPHLFGLCTEKILGGYEIEHNSICFNNGGRNVADIRYADAHSSHFLFNSLCIMTKT